jgi:hypothetical protein
MGVGTSSVACVSHRDERVLVDAVAHAAVRH